MPSRTFGEDVAAAVVLQDGAEADVEALRGFVAGRLAPFKVPRKIVFLDEIPKGADRQAAAYRACPAVGRRGLNVTRVWQ